MTNAPNELLEHVRQSAEGFEVFDELGRNGDVEIWYLARDLSAGVLVALRLKQEGADEHGRPAYSLEIAKELNAKVAMGLGECPKCKAVLRSYSRYCGKCGNDLTLGSKLPAAPADRAALLEQVRAAASDFYDVLGEMPWAGGVGFVYFALEKQSGRLVRLRLKIDESEYSLGETEALMSLDKLEAGYATTVLPALAPEAAPGAGPAPALPNEPSRPPQVEASPPSGRRPTVRYALIGIGIVALAVLAYVVFRS